jgi:2-amino-4-hydroxy-6-hydroxymethyldihydropteridine diphosphokinase
VIYIALGANLPSRAGLPAKTLLAAFERLAQSGIASVRVSRFYRSEAWPDPSDPEFVNAVASVSTGLSPRDLLTQMHAIEKSFGRDRSGAARPNAPRSLDLDLIDYEGKIQDGPPALPHPRMSTRAFVLVPLMEIAPEWRHPESGRSIDELVAELGDDAARVRAIA